MLGLDFGSTKYWCCGIGFQGSDSLGWGFGGQRPPERKEGNLLAKEFLLVDGYNITTPGAN